MANEGFNPNPNSGGANGLITSSTPAPMVGPVATGKKRPNTSATYGTITQAQLISKYGNMSPDARKALASKLKAAGFRVPVTGAYNEKVRAAYLDANIALNDEIKLLQQNDPTRLSQVAYNLDSYLADLAGAGTSTGAAGSQPFQRKIISNATEAAALINNVYADLLGRKASKKELEKYTSALQKAQEANPLKYTDTAGAGYTQRGGLDSQQFLIEQLAGTDEAKAYKVLNAYEAVNKLFGGLQ